MPVMKQLAEQPELLRPYLFHRMELQWTGKSDARGTCPFCMKEDKFFISQKTGQYECKVRCGGGNVYTFLRKLHQVSMEGTNAVEPRYNQAQTDRRIPKETLRKWGLVPSAIDGEWLLPAYGPKEEINNLYRWTPVKGKRRLIGTATLDGCMFGTQFGFYKDKNDVYITKAWDAMLLDYTLSKLRIASGGEPVTVASEKDSHRSKCHIIGLPGERMFKEKWAQYFAGRNVFIAFDNDYPKEQDGRVIEPAGLLGCQYVARRLKDVAKSIHYLKWHDDGFDDTLEDGFDVRDLLSSKE